MVVSGLTVVEAVSYRINSYSRICRASKMIGHVQPNPGSPPHGSSGEVSFGTWTEETTIADADGGPHLARTPPLDVLGGGVLVGADTAVWVQCRPVHNRSRSPPPTRTHDPWTAEQRLRPDDAVHPRATAKWTPNPAAAVANRACCRIDHISRSHLPNPRWPLRCSSLCHSTANPEGFQVVHSFAMGTVNSACFPPYSTCGIHLH